MFPTPESSDLGEVTADPVPPPPDPSNLGFPKPVIRDVLADDPPKPPPVLDDEDDIESLLPPPKPWMRLCSTEKHFI